MTEWTDNKLNGIEARATAVVAVGLTNSLSPLVIVRMAEESLEVIAELRRLQAMEERLTNMLDRELQNLERVLNGN